MTLEIWCVTATPSDFPNHFCVRRHFCARDYRGQLRDYHGQVAGVYDSLEQIEDDMLALGLAWVPRMPADDPVIVGTWL